MFQRFPSLGALAIAIAVLILPATAYAKGKVEQFAAPSGIVVNHVKCTGKSSRCMNTAAQFCNGSYQVLASESHAGGLLADVLPGPVRWYSMIFLCGKSDGTLPTFAFQGPQFQMPQIVIPRTINTTCTRSYNTVNCRTY